MPKQIFLSGHGGWKPGQGFATVPKGCKIHFYTSFAKNLITGMEYKILNGSYKTIERTIEEWHSCPNLRLSKQDDAWTTKSENELKHRNDPNCVLLASPEDGFTLAQLFQAWRENSLGAAHFHWMACQTLALKQVGGRDVGLNAGDFAHDPTAQGRYRIKKTATTYAWI